MNTLVVWMLIVSSWNSSKNEAEMMGPFADQASCIAVANSRPLENFATQCLQVKIPTGVKQ